MVTNKNIKVKFLFWTILKVVRMYFAAAGGEGLAKNSEPKS